MFLQKDGVLDYGSDLKRNETSAWDLIGKYATDVFANEAVRVIYLFIIYISSVTVKEKEKGLAQL